MRAIDIIEKKKKNEKLDYNEIQYMVNSYVKGKISDETMSNFIWLIYNNGLSMDETYYLTDVMVKSGEVIDLSSLDKPVVDKLSFFNAFINRISKIVKTHLHNFVHKVFFHNACAII